MGAFQQWRVYWLETSNGRSRARQKGFNSLSKAQAFGDKLAESNNDGQADIDKIRVVLNKKRRV